MMQLSRKYTGLSATCPLPIFSSHLHWSFVAALAHASGHCCSAAQAAHSPVAPSVAEKNTETVMVAVLLFSLVLITQSTAEQLIFPFLNKRNDTATVSTCRISGWPSLKSVLDPAHLPKHQFCVISSQTPANLRADNEEVRHSVTGPVHFFLEHLFRSATNLDFDFTYSCAIINSAFSLTLFRK